MLWVYAYKLFEKLPKSVLVFQIVFFTNEKCLDWAFTMRCFGFILVKEQWRRQGHGEVLLKAAIEKCRTRKVSCIMLHVDPLRTPALNLYKKHGFQVDCLVESYYSSDRNAYRMYLEFDSSWRRKETQQSIFFIYVFNFSSSIQWTNF